ncbi:MAG: hypothetical protein AAF566_00950 [Pseudomonadota bacterium]
MGFSVDVLLLGDFRFPGGTSSSIAAEARALTAAGYRVGLMAVASDILSPARMFNAEISQIIREGVADLVPPGTHVSARLACLHHPVVFSRFPARSLDVDAADAVLVVHHPPIDGSGAAQYNVEVIEEVTGALFGEIDWAPVGPKVRAAFARGDSSPPLTADDWVNVLDVDLWGGPRRALASAIPVIGRHSRPDPVKWPDTSEEFLGAYPDAEDLGVRLMGYDAALDEIVGPRPANWTVLPFDAEPVHAFLSQIDYFSYFHSDAWIEAFGRSILEAMAAGLVCFLPDHFEPLFGEGAVYTTPHEVAERARAFHAAPGTYLSQSEAATAFVRERFGPEQAVARVRARIGPPATLAGPVPVTPKPRVLYLTSNGVGLGHLTRALASARRLGPSAQPVVATMSRSFPLVAAEDIPVEFIPFHRTSGMNTDDWQAALGDEVAEMLRFYDPSVFVFDGNVPYQGLLDALSEAPAVWKIWQRRGMWRPDTGTKVLEREGAFDVVVAPGEVAGSLDRGLTARRLHRAFRVPPVRFLRSGEALCREDARLELGLDPGKPAVFFQLGSGNNFGTGGLFKIALQALTSLPHPPQIVAGVWQNSDAELALPDPVIPLRAFPFARYLAAFDYALAMAGYNTFHENLAAGLPTLFVGNENPEQDEQWLRAEFGRLTGLCLAARADDDYGVLRGLDALGSDTVRGSLSRACGMLSPENGADMVAEFLCELCQTRKRHALTVRALPPFSAR